MKKVIMLILSMAFVPAIVCGKVRLPSIISDNMVLQQNAEASIWGWSDPGSKITVTTSWDSKSYKAKAADNDGKWMLKVNTPKAGGPFTMTISDGDEITLGNILIGEVWFCSGQSNMHMQMQGYPGQPVAGAAELIATADSGRKIRMCSIARESSFEPLETSTGNWCRHNQKMVALCSATAYYFADLLERALKVPVGLVIADWGGSSIEAWMDKETIDSGFSSEFDFGYYEQHDMDQLKKERREHISPSLLFNGMVNPVIPYTFKGILWYQGCTNRARPDQYIRLQTAYAKMMRERFENPDAPFYFVQIAPYKYDNPDSYVSGYFREAQARTLELIPDSGMATTTDVGEFGTIHPSRKKEVGQRLAFLALEHTYGRIGVESDAPSVKNISFKKGEAEIEFKVGPLGISPIGKPLGGFELAGEDRVFHPAVGRVTGKTCTTVTVKSDEVPNPVAVRYCFRNWGTGSIFNNSGIPAGPFRSDNWSIEK